MSLDLNNFIFSLLLMISVQEIIENIVNIEIINAII